MLSFLLFMLAGMLVAIYGPAVVCILLVFIVFYARKAYNRVLGLFPTK